MYALGTCEATYIPHSIAPAMRQDSEGRPGNPGQPFGGLDFYPDLIDKAAVLACHIAWNHPLPDGNKRASWACLLLFFDLNGVVWDPDPPDFDEAEEWSSQWRHTTSTKCGLRPGYRSEPVRMTRDGSASN
jgi:hypothetical protein